MKAIAVSAMAYTLGVGVKSTLGIMVYGLGAVGVKIPGHRMYDGSHGGSYDAIAGGCGRCGKHGR